jgi:DNA-binding MarR family transcriptional regulator
MLCPKKKKAWSLCFVAHALMAKKIDEAMEEAGVIPLDVYDVLLNLEMAHGGRLRMSELAEAVLLSRSGLTRLIDRLEQKGLIERINCEQDRRSTYAQITEQGLSERKKAWPVFESQIEALFASQLSAGDEVFLTGIYGRVLKHMGRDIC